MNLTQSQRTTASSTVEQWSVYLDELHARIAHRFRRPELKERVQRYLTGRSPRSGARTAGRWRRPSEKHSRGAHSAS